MNAPMKMEGEMPTGSRPSPQSHFTVPWSVPVAALPVEVESIAEEDIDSEEQHIARQQRRQERDLEKLQRATGKGEQKKSKRRLEQQQDGPATQQKRQLVNLLSNLLDEKKMLSGKEEQLVKRLVDVGIDTQLEVERLHDKTAMLEKVVRRAEEED